ncbi:MAG: ribosomal protein S18-alanine N-acetyltransferase [Nitrosomonadales bacterium]|nr:ribosomal protein S18-alanine N-acetyltransferase [Nitrosomonadales bacterium]
MIRPMTGADIDAVLAIEQEVQPYPWTRGNFEDALNSGYLCRVESEEVEPGHLDAGIEIRGYAILRMVADEAELLTIGVAAGQQRKGLGRKMLRAMLEAARARDMRCMFLEVRASNAAALALYRSEGFLQIGVRRDYYRNGDHTDDAITMARELKDDGHGQE